MYVRNLRIIAAWKAFWPILRAIRQMALYCAAEDRAGLGSGFVATLSRLSSLGLLVCVPG